MEESSRISYTIQGTGRLSDFLTDRLVYRNLEAPDPRLPRRATLQAKLGMDSTWPPRKSEPAYGRLVAELLTLAHHLEQPTSQIERLVFIGDTRMNDIQAFRNLCAAGDWRGRVYIGCDDPTQPPSLQQEGDLALSNRWSLIADYLAGLEKDGFPLDERAAVVLDMDKTLIGPRGRNDRVIDEARLEAVQRLLAGLGEGFSADRFHAAYGVFAQPEYHPFTGDNQDALVTLCLMVGAGLFDLHSLAASIPAGDPPDFLAFLSRAALQRGKLSAILGAILAEVQAGAQAGDPTPFKRFRLEEYLCSAARFNKAILPVEQALAQRITLNGELCEMLAHLQGRGVLTFGLSDKPDEAACPSEVQARQGWLPLHRLRTLVVRERLS